MKNILVIDGHPDPSPERLSAALATAYQQGAEAAGCAVRRIDIGAIHFSMLRNATEFTSKAVDEAIIDAQGAFLKADHIVFIFPLFFC